MYPFISHTAALGFAFAISVEEAAPTSALNDASAFSSDVFFAKASPSHHNVVAALLPPPTVGGGANLVSALLA